MTQITLSGTPIMVAGHFPTTGESIADFTLTNNELNDITLAEFEGKRKILNIFPSIDTGICATSVRKFNIEAAKLNNTAVLCISADLPFAQTRFCGAEGIENAQTLSSFRHPNVLEALGVAIATGPLAGLAARAVIVLDENNHVLYSELVNEIKQEPNYTEALTVL